MFKNARSTAEDRGLLSSKDAPSFFVECLIYNVPDDRFRSTHSDTFFSVLEWLHGRDTLAFVYGNHMDYLFGVGPEQWNALAAQRTVQALVNLWNNW
jgi:hypothetical protein